jgi:hypothetical protein
MTDAGPLELEAMMNALCLSNDNWVDDSAWQYYDEKYNAEREVRPVCEFHREIELVKCPVGQDLVKYLANREKDRKRSQSNLHRMRNNLLWCRRQESLDQEYIHNYCEQDFQRRGGGDGVPFTASPDVGIKNLHVM